MLFDVDRIKAGVFFFCSRLPVTGSAAAAAALLLSLRACFPLSTHVKPRLLTFLIAIYSPYTTTFIPASHS